MRSSRIRHLTAVGALALIVMAPAAACGADSLSPMPVEAAGAEPSVAASDPPVLRPSVSVTDSSPPRIPGPATQPRRPAPIKTKTTKAEPTDTHPNCFGAVRYELDLQNTVLDLHKSMCFHVGGTLRLQSIGPGLVTTSPSDLVSPNYEAGVQDLRFIHPGTVTVTIPQDGQNYTITVVVIS